MLIFTDYAGQDSHQHKDFRSTYLCYLNHVRNCRLQNDAEALSLQFTGAFQAVCQEEYMVLTTRKVLEVVRAGAADLLAGEIGHQVEATKEELGHNKSSTAARSAHDSFADALLPLTPTLNARVVLINTLIPYKVAVANDLNTGVDSATHYKRAKRTGEILNTLQQTPPAPSCSTPPGSPSNFVSTATSSEASSSSASAVSTSALFSVPELNAAKKGSAFSITHTAEEEALDFAESAVSDKASTAASKRKAGADDEANTSAKVRRKNTTDADALFDSDEVEEFISRIMWTVDNKCVWCLVEVYQEKVIDALRRRELRKSEPANDSCRNLNATPLMKKVFGLSRLKQIRRSFVVDLNLDMPEFHDQAVMKAIRLTTDDHLDQALDALGVVTDRGKLRGVCSQLRETSWSLLQSSGDFTKFAQEAALMNLPEVEDPPTQTRIRPDFKREIAFGVITGHQQKADNNKNGMDLWRLTRFGKSVLDEGSPMVPLVQVIYEQGTIYKLVVRIRGIMVLAKVGVFTVPMHRNAIGAFQASMPTLEWFRVMFDAWNTASAIILGDLESD
ncbi:hypothetical protein BGX34_003588 [Mortierella sp. NVP85]|nr:hypothetical protein BGX34_003588 [Mortierella sp. NVP85]